MYPLTQKAFRNRIFIKPDLIGLSISELETFIPVKDRQNIPISGRVALPGIIMEQIKLKQSKISQDLDIFFFL